MSRIERCDVSFVDSQGITQISTVEATSVYEAVCRGWIDFKKRSEESFENSYKAKEFVVKVLSTGKTYNVDPEKLLEWLDPRGNGRRTKELPPRKKFLDRVLNDYGP